MSNTQEKWADSHNMIDNSMQKMWDMGTVSLGGLSWAHDQVENMYRNQLDQNKTARKDLVKLIEDLSKQMRRNQEQFQKIVEESVMNTYQHINYTNHSLIDDLAQKVDDLSNKVAKV